MNAGLLINVVYVTNGIIARRRQVMKSKTKKKKIPAVKTPVVGFTTQGVRAFGYESGVTRNQIVSELSRSSHGSLQEYVPMGKAAAAQEPEFFAHLISWNRLKGAVRDSQVALPVLSLTGNMPTELEENSLAHIALLGPRELEKAVRFSMELKLPTRKRVAIRNIVSNYLHEREGNNANWDRIALQHRKTLKTLYALTYTKPSDRANKVLFDRDYPVGSVFEVVERLKDMTPIDAAAAITDRRIPFLIALGALGKKSKEPALVQALIERMTPTELVTNTKMFEKLGIKTDPALRGAFEKALEKASKGKKNVLKTTRAAEAIEDEGLKEKLRGVQEKQIANLGGVDGNWLVLGDRSGSMADAIEVARQVAATLSKMVKGKVHLVFFDTCPQSYDVSGMALDQINALTKFVVPGGGTSIGCGLQRLLDSKTEIDGIAVVSDAAENSPPHFVDVYKKYSAMFSKEVPVYLYRCGSGGSYSDIDLAKSMKAAGYDLQEFDIRGGLDFYSLPNLVATMNTNRYSLLDQVMATPLLTLNDVFKSNRKETVQYA